MSRLGRARLQCLVVKQKLQSFCCCRGRIREIPATTWRSNFFCRMPRPPLRAPRRLKRGLRGGLIPNQFLRDEYYNGAEEINKGSAGLGWRVRARGFTLFTSSARPLVYHGMPGRALDKSKPLITAEGSAGPHRVVRRGSRGGLETVARFPFIFSSVQRAVNLSDYCGLSVHAATRDINSQTSRYFIGESRYLR